MLKAFANSLDPDETPQKVASHQDPNYNIVITEDDSTTTATNKVHTNYDSQGICRLNPDQGYSRSNLAVKWYYHHGNNTCYRFWYEGLGGNGNRFENETICLQTCYRRQNTEEETCSMPPMTGRDCKARMSRYYYDKSRGECLQFIYGGCGGNNNNFQSKADCERECRAGSSDKVIAVTEMALGDQEQDCRTSRYGCCSDGVTKARGDNQLGCPHPCKDSEFGCCPDGVTPAQGTDEDGCEDIDIVSGAGSLCDTLANGCCPDGVTPAKGPYNAGCDDDGKGVIMTTAMMSLCHAMMSRCQLYVDNPRTRDHGNSNRFKSEKECLTMCTGNVRPIVTTPTATPGPCRASLPRYFYNYNTGYCEQFSYGGSLKVPSVVLKHSLFTTFFPELTAAEGSCENNRLINVPLPSLMYFYNSQTGRCEEFQYNGCGGNRNRFVYCRAPRRPGLQQRTVAYPANFFAGSNDPDTRNCRTFRYGGCQGNRNNFATDQECTATCLNEVIPVTARPPVTRAPTPAAKEEDVCTLPLVQPCDNEARVADWGTFYYYNVASGECCEAFCNRDKVCQPLTYNSEVRCLPTWSAGRTPPAQTPVNSFCTVGVVVAPTDSTLKWHVRGNAGDSW
ncbi:hypothetical protein DPMN_086696 [Dreissena polymorpha]|uniref:BPTI/Kunitz inhibitor domain-containing protein n=1 Tax=Dreissena polymorpha TaxID=45954 RepID=A0A9D4QVF3_DREPO|nr:hypothetical protein DPMN_086696 [Dreissena polymorpha]